MTVKVVTDSGADIPEEILKELEIETVPYLVQFGGASFRDGIDIGAEEVYKLLGEGVHLTTAAPPPNDFTEAYRRVIQGEDEIISIHISQKLSRVYESALSAKTMVEKERKCQIEVIDSWALVMGMGFLAILAAKLAKEGESLKEIVKAVEEAIPRVHLLGVLDTLEYVFRGGRLGDSARLLEGLRKAEKLLKLKAVLTLKDGEVRPAGLIRAHKRKERLIEFIRGFPKVKEVAVEYATDKDREAAEGLLGEIKSLFPGITYYISQISPVLGVHSGPGALIVALREE